MSTDLRDQIANDLRGLIATFASPPSEDDFANGWSEETWAKWGGIFRDLLERLLAGAPLANASITRPMDFDGIAGGVVMERAAGIRIPLGVFQPRG